MLRLVIALAVVTISQVSLAAPLAFELASKTGDEWDASFRWGANEQSILVSANGSLELNGALVSPSRKHIKLPLQSQEWISRLSALRVGADIFIAFDTDDGDSGRGMLCRIGVKSASIRWCQDIPGFNIFGAVGRDSAIFVGAIGFVGRLHPETGRIVWQQSDLYTKDKTFNIFCAPVEEENTVSMYATTGIVPSAGKRILLDRRSGKILSISEAKVSGGCP